MGEAIGVLYCIATRVPSVVLAGHNGIPVQISNEYVTPVDDVTELTAVPEHAGVPDLGV
jgi:hypothetical protein